MSKFINIHIIHNYPVSCLNRDDANTPKDCEIGGYTRARISSQCLKRAVRFHLGGEFSLGTRSRQFPQLLINKLIASGKNQDATNKLVGRAFDAFSSMIKDKSDEEENTVEENTEEQKSVLLHVPPLYDQKLDEISKFICDNWDSLKAVVVESKGKKTKKWNPKKDTPDYELKKHMEKFVGNPQDAVDIALFGRMLASNTDFTVDGVCSVAHAFSTNKIKKDTDFFTAVDDLSHDSGAGMMGNIDFNSACYYQFATVDYTRLSELMGNDSKKIALACVNAFAKANPSGKQNTMCALTPPDFILVAIGNQRLSYANAFVKPIRPDEKDLITNSIEALIKESDSLKTFFNPVICSWCRSMQIANSVSDYGAFMTQVGEQL
jgi:CRISPR system Cascade subunit CasC